MLIVLVYVLVKNYKGTAATTNALGGNGVNLIKTVTG